ncbi:AAA family ATPase [Synechococcus sp. Nb3U1]|uniref:AAA family ATPase n=1 Tax=Synechococcus sp. Nb3U1 TaxID=1914529 RepID=UPI001F3720E9|nr:AAA family ATPase [Synechococcus sp. Nb3U1]MCF2969712.1 AAA family ATPase [Synechococcus sp. Nb3U1]
MRILSLALQNFKSHVDTVFEFEPGTNAICGENGAGKTSILEAIAWALFDHSPYSQEEMIRVGASDAVVTVQFVSQADQRTYTVRRSVTQGYRLFDPQLNQRLDYERKVDVLPWLRQHLGVPTGTDLARLFATTIGVPQGTFTADFLKTGRDRKEIFDRILKVEEYQAVAKDLLAVEKHSEAKIQEIKHQIELFNQQLQDWNSLQLEQKKLMQDLSYWQEQLQQQNQVIQQTQVQLERLESLLRQIQIIDQQLREREQQEALLKVSQEQAEALLQQARQAQAQRDQCLQGSQLFLAAETQLRDLEKQQQQRFSWLKQRDHLLSQQQAIDTELTRLQEKLRQLEQWKQELEDLNPKLQAQQDLEAEQVSLTQHLNRLLEWQMELERLRGEWATQSERCQLLQSRVQEAEEASAICRQHQPAYTRYQDLETQIAQREVDQQTRNRLGSQREKRLQELHHLQIQEAEYKQQLLAFEQIEQEIHSLNPLIKQQGSLEKQLLEIEKRLTPFQSIRLELKQKETEQIHLQQQLQQLEDTLRQRRGYLEQVARIPELEAQQERIQIQLSRIAAAQQFHQEMQTLLEQGTNRLQQQQQSIQSLLQDLELQQQQYPEWKGIWERIHDMFSQSSTLSQDLLQSIHNILRDLTSQTDKAQLNQQFLSLQEELKTLQPLLGLTRQLPELESHRQELLQAQIELQNKIDDIHWSLEAEPTFIRQQQELNEQLQKLGDPRAQLKRLEKELQKKAPIQRRWQQLVGKIDPIRADIQLLDQQLQPLEDIEERILSLKEEQRTCRNGYEKVITSMETAKSLAQRQRELQMAQAELNQIQNQGQQKQAQIHQWEQERGTAEKIRTQLEQLRDSLMALGDPRGQAERLRLELKAETECLRSQADYLQQRQQIQAELEKLQKSLLASEHLEQEMGSLQQQRDQYRSTHENYLQAEPVAQLLPEREKALENLKTQWHMLQTQMAQLRAQRDPLICQFQLEDYESHKALLQTVKIKEAEAKAHLESIAPQLMKIQERVQQLEQVKDSLKKVETERSEKERLHRFIKFSREVYKKAGPQITQHYLQQINHTADQLFREILNRPNVSLTWEPDYEIRVQEGSSTKRRFASLSGGEQMCAALAVRLALLKVLGQLDIAFFDEPTTNMDMQRRRRLAEAITNLRSFQQLFVISHDDTFEQVTENIIRVERSFGLTTERRDPFYGA